MIVTRILPIACPRCDQQGTYGVVFVQGNSVLRGCSACETSERIPLPEIRKRVLYLDQNFLSHAFRQADGPFVDASKRIASLADRQLLACPWSPLHELETHLWRHEQREALWTFIKRTARGHRFRQPEVAKEAQVWRSFRRFIDHESPSVDLKERDVLLESIHTWDDHYWIEAGRFVDDTDRIRGSKRQAATELVGLFDGWEGSPSTFADDVSQEARGYGNSLFDLYFRKMQALAGGSIVEYLNSPAEAHIIEALLVDDREALELPRRLSRVAAFLASEHFRETPYVDASCRLFGVLRKLVRSGQFRNRARAVDALSGFYFDVEAVATYVPYCDAAFLDREMRRWTIDVDCALNQRYSFEVFSTDVWDQFNAFLEDVEGSETEEHRRHLALAYP